MCPGIPFNIFQPAVIVFGINAGPNLARTSFLSRRWRIYPLQSMSLKAASDRPVFEIGNIMLFVQLGDQHVSVGFGVVDKTRGIATLQEIVNQQIAQKDFSNLTPSCFCPFSPRH